MAMVSRKGWIIRTALRDGRDFFEHVDGNVPHSERRSEIEMRSIIEARMNNFVLSYPSPEDHAQESEVVWTLRELGPNGSFKGSYLRFLAPNIYVIRRTRQQDAERARIARQAKKERAELKRAMNTSVRTINSHGTGKGGAGVDPSFQVDDQHGGDGQGVGWCAPMQAPITTPAARRSGGMRL